MESTLLKVFPEPYQVQGTALCPVSQGQRCVRHIKHNPSLQETQDLAEDFEYIQSLVTEHEQESDIGKYSVRWAHKDSLFQEPSGREEMGDSGEP